ncbi:MFS transporter [Aminomonas paucivorans]
MSEPALDTSAPPRSPLLRPFAPHVPLILYGLLVTAYFFSNFFRISAAVLLPRLAVELGMTAAATGFISSLFFYTYGAVQPLCGALNDRFGPLKVGGIGMGICALGVGLFLVADTPFLLGTARLLTGLGVAPIFSGVLVHQANALPRERYAAFTGITVAVGNLGAVVSVAPLGTALDAWGRGPVFAALTLVSLALGGFFFLTRRDDPVVLHHQRQDASAPVPLLEGLTLGFRILARSRSIRVATLIWASLVGALLSLQGLWGVAWFETAYGCSPAQARFWATLLGVGMMAGTLWGGRVAARGGGRVGVFARTCAAVGGTWVLFWACMALRLPLWVSGVAGGLIGVTTGVAVILCNAALNDLVGRERIGSLLGTANLTVFVSVILCQWGTGAVLGLLPGARPGLYHPGGFLLSYGVLIGLLFLCFLPLRTVRSFKDETVR